MYGEAARSLRRWSRCLCAAKASALSSSARLLFTPDEPFEDQDHGADRDRRVGDVERRPVPAERVEIEEIDHLAETQAVDDVADRAAQDQRQTEAEDLPLRAAHDADAHHDRRDHREGAG